MISLKELLDSCKQHNVGSFRNAEWGQSGWLPQVRAEPCEGLCKSSTSQGCHSYTLLSESGSIVQFRSKASSLDISTTTLAREIHLHIASTTTYQGLMPNSSVSIWVMETFPGVWIPLHIQHYHGGLSWICKGLRSFSSSSTSVSYRILPPEYGILPNHTPKGIKQWGDHELVRFSTFGRDSDIFSSSERNDSLPPVLHLVATAVEYISELFEYIMMIDKRCKWSINKAFYTKNQASSKLPKADVWQILHADQALCSSSRPRVACSRFN